MNKFILIVVSILFFTAMPFNKLLAQTFTLNTFEVPPYVEKNKGLAIDIIKELFTRANIKIYHISTNKFEYRSIPNSAITRERNKI